MGIRKTQNFIKSFFTVVGVMGIIVGFIFLVAWVTSLLWNWLMPLVFGLPEITTLQALGLQLLSSLLIRSNYTYNKKKS
jgi:hypothetical protein